MGAGFGYHAIESARVAELVDARDLKSLGGFHRAGSIPALGTNKINTVYDIRPLHETGRLKRHLSMNKGKTSSKAEKTILSLGNW